MYASTNQILQRLMKIPPSYFVSLILVLILWVATPQLLNLNVMGIFIRQVAPLGIVVLGQLLVMNVRSIDLSAGGTILLINYYISSDLFGDIDRASLIAICIATGLFIGLFNGLMIGKRRVSAVIVTLAVNIILIGIVEYLANGKPPGDIPEYLRDIYNSKFLSIPTPVIFWIVLTALMGIYLSRFVFGRFITSIGENPVAAHFSGVPVEKTVVIAHTIAGLMAALAGLVQTASIAVGSVRFGPQLVMNSIAATILGGVIFGRGSGGVWGPFFGVISFAFLFVVMTTFGVQEAGKLIDQGLIILLAAIFYGLRQTTKF
jgi:ribose transport system permease protein